MFKNRFVKYSCVSIIIIITYFAGFFFGIHKGYRFCYISNLPSQFAEKIAVIEKIKNGENKKAGKLIELHLDTALKEFNLFLATPSLTQNTEFYIYIMNAKLKFNIYQKNIIDKALQYKSGELGVLNDEL